MLNETLIAPLVAGYLLGSIPFGLLLVKLLGKGDLRQTGSGNIGATNAVRAAGKKVGAVVFLLDAVKGAAAVLVGNALGGPTGALVGGAAALIGHCYPLWLRFKGGKGVATLFGILFALQWQLGAIALGVWVAAFLITRMSSAGGLLAAASAPIAGWGYEHARYYLLGFTLLIFWKHRANIARILSGTEPRFGAKTRDGPSRDDPSTTS